METKCFLFFTTVSRNLSEFWRWFIWFERSVRHPSSPFSLEVFNKQPLQRLANQRLKIGNTLVLTLRHSEELSKSLLFSRNKTLSKPLLFCFKTLIFISFLLILFFVEHLWLAYLFRLIPYEAKYTFEKQCCKNPNIFSYISIISYNLLEWRQFSKLERISLESYLLLKWTEGTFWLASHYFESLWKLSKLFIEST